MKILYVIHQFYPEFGSGTEKFLFNISSALQRDGNTVHVVAYTFQECDTRREGGVLVREYLYRGIPVTAVRETKLPIDINTSWGTAAVAKFAQEFLRKQKPDIVHLAHAMRLGPFAAAAEMLGIPYVMTLTDFWTICPKITLQTSSGNLCAGPKGGDECLRLCPELNQDMVRARLRQSRHVLENAQAVVTPSRFVASLVQAEFPKIKVRIIPHGIRRPRSLLSPKTYGPGDKLVFGYAGGLAPHKGVHILISAFRNVKGAAELRIYGSHFEQPDYFELLKQTANGDTRIRFCGTYSDDRLDSIFQEFDVLVVPSVWYETYSFSAHEALARGVPVIASKLGALQEAVQDGVSGFTVAPGNVEDLARKVEAVIAHPEQLNQITANLRARVTPMLEEEAYVYQRIYDSRSELISIPPIS
jgi:glycosyltransferase involved in cell wall biosynthesis